MKWHDLLFEVCQFEIHVLPFSMEASAWIRMDTDSCTADNYNWDSYDKDDCIPNDRMNSKDKYTVDNRNIDTGNLCNLVVPGVVVVR